MNRILSIVTSGALLAAAVPGSTDVAMAQQAAEGSGIAGSAVYVDMPQAADEPIVRDGSVEGSGAAHLPVTTPGEPAAVGPNEQAGHVDGPPPGAFAIDVAAPPAAPLHSPWQRPRMQFPDERVRLDEATRVRVERGARVTRIGRILTGVGAGVLLVSSVAAVASGVECTWADEQCAEYGSALSGLALGATALWAGTVTWSSGTLVAANAMRRGGAPVSNTAGIIAVTASVLWFPGAWVAAPVQHHQNRRGWDRWVDDSPRAQLRLLPAVAGGQFGATLSLQF